MSDINVLAEKYRYGYSYKSLIKDLEYPVVFTESYGDYEGDVIFIVYNPMFDLYGYGSIGYGSCSYCDTMQGIQDQDSDLDVVKGMLQFMRDTEDSITWYSLPELAHFIIDHDYEGSHMAYYADDIRRDSAKAIMIFEYTHKLTTVE